jgi:hypothetical protein
MRPERVRFHVANVLTEISHDNRVTTLETLHVTSVAPCAPCRGRERRLAVDLHTPFPVSSSSVSRAGSQSIFSFVSR